MRQKMNNYLFVFVISSLLLAACAPAAATNSAGQPTAKPVSAQLTGSGATFPEPIYKEWIFAYTYVQPAVSINYQGIGSGGGKKAIVDRTVDFAGSDSLVTDAEYAAGGDLQMLPMLAGAVVPIYNIAGLAAEDVLVLDRAALVGIYDGSIKKWNDAAILKTNQALASKLPDVAITVVHRSDGSGTTEIFTRALSAFDAAWKANVGAGSSVQWPVDAAGNGVGGKGNQGVAAAVQNSPNSIGYVELAYATANKISTAALVNKSGQVVKANAESVQAAMVDFAGAFDAKLTATVVDAPGAGSWPILGYTYLVVHMNSMTDCGKASALAGFINWALSDPGASKKAVELGYAPLPDAVRKVVLEKLQQMTCGGKAVLNP